MRKTLTLFIATAFGATTMVFGQLHRNCSTMHVHDRLSKEDPSYIENLKHVEEHTSQYVLNPTTSNKTNAVITIPVVVHVVYNTSTQNISDAQIQSQIDVLNEDFRKLNADRTLIPTDFSSVAADAEIQFCLAKRDPNGLSTTGIIRKSTTVTSFSSDDKVKSSTTGGSNAWPASSYLNLWVCNLGGGLLGYAQFPGGPASTDGVVIGYTCFGRTGTAQAPFNKGRTGTHEVGHWLNLRHIWGDAACGSDLVSDTPTHDSENYGCPTQPHLSGCTGKPREMTMNYMDYTDDACMYMFSTGQKSRMQALFTTGGARASLATSQGCVTPSGATCATPSGLLSSSITTSSATVSWTAVSGATSYNIQYKPTSLTTWTTTTSTTASKSLTGLTAATTYEFKVQAVCTSTGSYSASATFTTTAATSGCGTDAWEANNSFGTAKTITLARNINGLICPSTDVDWFKFTNTSLAKNIKVTLSTLPYDYDLYLYNSAGTLLRSSENGGTTSETVIYNNGAVSTYYVAVVGYNGATSSQSQYTVYASTRSTAYKDAFDAENDESLSTGLTFYPNPAQNELNLTFSTNLENQVSVKVVDLLGKVVLSDIRQASIGENQWKLDLNSLDNGLYILQVVNGDEVTTEKFQINR